MRCVTSVNFNLNHKLSTNGVISYKIADEDLKNYNLDQVGLSLQVLDMENIFEDGETTIGEYSKRKTLTLSPQIYNYAIIKNERMQEYLDEIKEIDDEDKENCSNVDKFSYHCKNNEVVNDWYFYKNPKEYIFYHDRKKLKKVLNYKIQIKYPSFSSSKIMNIKIMLLLLFSLLIY